MIATPTDASPASTPHLSMLLYKQSLCQFLRSVDEHPIPGHAHTHQGSTLTPWLLSSVCVSRATLARGLWGYLARGTLCRAKTTHLLTIGSVRRRQILLTHMYAGRAGGFEPLSGTGDAVSPQEPHAVPLPGTAAPSGFRLDKPHYCQIVTRGVRLRDLPCHTRMKIAVRYQR